MEAVTIATMVLEDSPLTNAGYGSNLTWNGSVECDASIVDGSNMHYGGVGAVSGIKNPITLAKLICEKQKFNMSFGRIPPWYIIIIVIIIIRYIMFLLRLRNHICDIIK